MDLELNIEEEIDFDNQIDHPELVEAEECPNDFIEEDLFVVASGCYSPNTAKGMGIKNLIKNPEKRRQNTPNYRESSSEI